MQTELFIICCTGLFTQIHMMYVLLPLKGGGEYPLLNLFWITAALRIACTKM